MQVLPMPTLMYLDSPAATRTFMYISCFNISPLSNPFNRDKYARHPIRFRHNGIFAFLFRFPKIP